MSEDSYDYDNLKDEWVELARNDMPTLIKVLENFNHDYNTSALATAVLAYAGYEHMAKKLGITGFQAGYAALEFLTFTEIYEIPFFVRSYRDMLYPQYEIKFKSISRKTFEYLQSEANEKLENESDLAHKEVIAHWQSIADGHVPFGYIIDG